MLTSLSELITQGPEHGECIQCHYPGATGMWHDQDNNLWSWICLPCADMLAIVRAREWFRQAHAEHVSWLDLQRRAKKGLME